MYRTFDYAQEDDYNIYVLTLQKQNRSMKSNFPQKYRFCPHVLNYILSISILQEHNHSITVTSFETKEPRRIITRSARNWKKRKKKREIVFSINDLWREFGTIFVIQKPILTQLDVDKWC